MLSRGWKKKQAGDQLLTETIVRRTIDLSEGKSLLGEDQVSRQCSRARPFGQRKIVGVVNTRELNSVSVSLREGE